MEKRDYVIQVKYSVAERSENGKNKIFKKKTEKSLDNIDSIKILNDIYSIENTLKKEERYSIPKTHSGYFSSLTNFIRKWKNAYYEMLTL